MMQEYFKGCMTREDLEREHRRLVVRMHPDRNTDNPNATAEFQEMQSQYEERLAELNGDYTKARKGRQRREREEREQGRRKVEQAIEQARLNKQKAHTALKQGDYIYARMVTFTRKVFCRNVLSADDLLHVVVEQGVKDETVVVVETIVELSDEDFFGIDGFTRAIPDSGPWGGWETLQQADPANGVPKAKRVAKVVMFRSPNYCAFGNPKGDRVVSDYYVPTCYQTMFSDHLHRIEAGIRRKEEEMAQLEQERKARLQAEQMPLISEWQDRLITLSAGLTAKERDTVAVDNLKAMLRGRFPGVTFRLKHDRYEGWQVRWEDGPTSDEVHEVVRLFDWHFCISAPEQTPWQERFGSLEFSLTEGYDRTMSVLTKARILQQLGQVADGFRTAAIDDDVTVTDMDWMLLHLLVGMQVGQGETECMSTVRADGTRTVNVGATVRFVFGHSSYTKKAKTTKKSSKQKLKEAA